MLNIGKLAAGGEGYYLCTVASGVEDYYTGAGEAPGYWLGAADGDLGLAGRVQPEALRAVLAAAHPETGAPLTGRAGRRSVPGFDLCFRAPKSVSLLYGLGNGETSAQVRDGHDAAVAAAVGYLERHAAWSRRGHGGTERVAVSGFVAAGFRHRTSRAGDPLLHTHVLVANQGQATDDGQWRTLDARALYTHAKTAGFLYQAALRAELTGRLGVEWGPVRNGCADLEGMPDEVIAAFSRRRTEIRVELNRRGESSAKAAQMATLATRRAKDRDVEPRALSAEWLARAAALGFSPEHLEALVGRDADQGLDQRGLQEAAERLAGPEGLTARASTFTRRDVIQGWCQQLPAGAHTGQVEALADAVLDQSSGAAVRLDHAQAVARQLTAADVIRRGDGRVVAADADEPRYSVLDLLALEQRVVAQAALRRHAGAGIAEPAAVTVALARRPGIAGEQAAMVRALTGSGAGVEVVVGKAGAGKTFALDAARDAWQASGIRVIGCALAARAAAELQDGAGIASTSVDALLWRADRPAHAGGGLPPGCVMVVDEAAMVGTRKLARLLDHAAQADAKVVLVGDHHQLPEIDAGGLFRGLVNRLPAVALTDNRRQAHDWEREALDHLRDGEPAAALAAYHDHGRVITGDTAEAVREQLVADWWAAQSQSDGQRGVMIAARVADVEDLNARARVRLAAAGELTGPALGTAAGREFQAGDRVVCLRNDRRLGVVNGSRGRVEAVDARAHALTVRVNEGKAVTLAGAYLNAGHLAHGYALTAHKAQGMTADQAWVLGSDASYREWGYVALSRGRQANHLYVLRADDAPDDQLHDHGATVTADPIAGLTLALQRSRGQRLGVDHAAHAGHAGSPAPDLVAGSGDGRRSNRDIAWRQSPELSRLSQRQTAAVERAQAVERQLDAARRPLDDRKGLRRLRRADARAARADVARLSQDLRAWQAHIADLDTALAQLMQSPQHGRPSAAGGGSDELGLNGTAAPAVWRSQQARAAARGACG